MNFLLARRWTVLAAGALVTLFLAFAATRLTFVTSPESILITGDREMEMMGRYEENAYLWRMMKVVGHPDTRLYEMDGYGHNMLLPAYPLLINEVKRIVKLKK